MRRPDQPALTDAATGRVSMPFLPTLAVVALLGVASLYCPSSNPTPARVRAESVEPVDPLSRAGTHGFRPRRPRSPTPGRLPAALVFAESYPLDCAGARTGPSPPRSAMRGAGAAGPLRRRESDAPARAGAARRRRARRPSSDSLADPFAAAPRDWRSEPARRPRSRRRRAGPALRRHGGRDPGSGCPGRRRRGEPGAHRRCSRPGLGGPGGGRLPALTPSARPGPPGSRSARSPMMPCPVPELIGLRLGDGLDLSIRRPRCVAADGPGRRPRIGAGAGWLHASRITRSSAIAAARH